jgi:hypothetical protein
MKNAPIYSPRPEPVPASLGMDLYRGGEMVFLEKVKE